MKAVRPPAGGNAMSDEQFDIFRKRLAPVLYDFFTHYFLEHPTQTCRHVVSHPTMARRKPSPACILNPARFAREHHASKPMKEGASGSREGPPRPLTGDVTYMRVAGRPSLGLAHGPQVGLPRGGLWLQGQVQGLPLGAGGAHMHALQCACMHDALGISCGPPFTCALTGVYMEFTIRLSIGSPLAARAPRRLLCCPPPPKPPTPHTSPCRPPPLPGFPHHRLPHLPTHRPTRNHLPCWRC